MATKKLKDNNKGKKKSTKTKGRKREKLKQDPYKGKEFEAYLLWKSLPVMWRGLAEEELIKLGIGDDDVVELLEIKTQKEFGKKFKVSVKAMWEWNERIRSEDALVDETKKWARQMMGNIIGAVYKKQQIEGDAPRSKFLAEFAESFKTTIDMRSDDIKEQTEVLRKLAERK